MLSHERARGRAVILTALEVEYEAVRAHLLDLQEEVHNGSVYERGTFIGGGWHWEVGIIRTGMGNAATAFQSERAIDYFSPDIAIFVGIAGGIKDVALGDVVAATKVYGYESGKVVNSAFHARPEVGQSNFRLIQRAMAQARKKEWLQRIQSVSSIRTLSPRAHVGAIAAGEKVVASTRNDTCAFLKSHYGDALAVEMEGRGFLEAVYGNEHVQALVIRGISDLLDKKSKSDVQGFQDVAARHASAFAFEILANLDKQLSAFQSPAFVEKQGLHLIDAYIEEDDETPKLNIILHNAGSQVALAKRAKIDVLNVGAFYGPEEARKEMSRSFLPSTYTYEVEFSPELKGQSISKIISQTLHSNDVDRFEIAIEQNHPDPTLIYVWYYLKITIQYDMTNSTEESEPLLFSVPPVDLDQGDVWKITQHAPWVEQNMKTLHRMAELEAQRSDSVAETLREISKRSATS